MSDFHDTATYPKARKPHRCVWCYAGIPVGERYVQQTGFYEGKPYRNRYHHECWDALNDSGENEFCPGEGEIPERLLAAAAALAGEANK